MPDTPNILLIMTDQQHWDTLRCHGYDHMITPNVDQVLHGHRHTHGSGDLHDRHTDHDLGVEDGPRHSVAGGFEAVPDLDKVHQRDHVLPLGWDPHSWQILSRALTTRQSAMSPRS